MGFGKVLGLGKSAASIAGSKEAAHIIKKQAKAARAAKDSSRIGRMFGGRHAVGLAGAIGVTAAVGGAVNQIPGGLADVAFEDPYSGTSGSDVFRNITGVDPSFAALGFSYPGDFFAKQAILMKSAFSRENIKNASYALNGRKERMIANAYDTNAKMVDARGYTGDEFWAGQFDMPYKPNVSTPYAGGNMVFGMYNRRR